MILILLIITVIIGGILFALGLNETWKENGLSYDDIHREFLRYIKSVINREELKENK